MIGIVRHSQSSERPGVVPVIAILMKGELLGDAITHVPALRALRIACPDHRIIGIYKAETVWTKSLSRMKHEFFDEIWLGSPSRDNVRSIRELLKRIPGLAVVLDFQSNGRALLSYLATAGMGVRYAANVAGFGLRHGLARRWMVRPRSNARRYHRIVELIADRILPFSARLEADERNHRLAERLLGNVRRFVCVVPGPSTHRKFWSKENWIRLSRHLAANGITPVFLLGPAEHIEKDWLQHESAAGSVIIDRNVVTDLDQLPGLFIAIADRAMGAVACDGGIGHVIATSGLPLLTIAGPTSPERWQPVTPHHWSAWARQYGSRETKAVPFEDVAARVDELIEFSDRFYRPQTEIARRLPAVVNFAEAI